MISAHSGREMCQNERWPILENVKAGQAGGTVMAEHEEEGQADRRTHNVCADVAVKASFVPMLAAAIICTAHPQSMDATDAMEPIVLESACKYGEPQTRMAEKLKTCIRLSMKGGGASAEMRENMSRNTAVRQHGDMYVSDTVPIAEIEAKNARRQM